MRYEIILTDYEIKFVPSYAVGIFHTRSIFHSFRKEQISLKKGLHFREVLFSGGTAQICLHFCQRQKLRFASIQLSAATVHRTVAI